MTGVGARAILLTLLAGMLATFCWAARRGFNLTDEGCYYLEYSFPSDVTDLHTSFHLLGRLVLETLGWNMVAFRIASMVLLAAAAEFFGDAVVRHLRRVSGGLFLRSVGRLETAPIWILAALTFFSVSPAALTYNSINAAAVFVCVGLLVGAIDGMGSGNPRSHRAGLLRFCGAFLVASCDLFIKPPTAIALGAAALGLFAATPLLPLRAKLQSLVGLAAGLAVGLGASVVVVGGWTPLIDRLANLNFIVHNSQYIGSLAGQALHDSITLSQMVWADAFWPAAGALVAGVAAGLSQRGPFAPPWLKGAALAVIAALWLQMICRIPGWDAAWRYYMKGAVARANLDTILVLAAALLGCSLVGLRQKAMPNRSAVIHCGLLCAMLLVMPIAGAFGTTNLLYLNAAYHVPCWTAVTLWLAFLLIRRCNVHIAPTVALLPVAGLCAAQYLNGAVFNPYGLGADLFAETVETPVGWPASRLALNAEDSHFIDTTRRILQAHGFKPGDDIFAFFNMPGLVYAVGGRSPVIPWYFGRIYAGDGIEASYMRAAGELRRQRAFIITQDDVTRFRDHFRDGGIDFPDGYDLIGSLTNPNTALPVKIWKPKGRPD